MGMAHFPAVAFAPNSDLLGIDDNQDIQGHVDRDMEDIYYADAHLQSAERGSNRIGSFLYMEQRGSKEQKGAHQAHAKHGVASIWAGPS